MSNYWKYGGIIPEIINTSFVTWIENAFINNTGQIIPTSTESGKSHYTTGIYLDPGKYKVKLISNATNNYQIANRIHRYNLGYQWQEMLDNYYTTGTFENAIYSQTIKINTPSYIRISTKYYINILEIEKL